MKSVTKIRKAVIWPNHRSSINVNYT